MSTGQVLRAGVPQLTVPDMGDQHDHGRRIAAPGVGAVQ
jgi:rhamnosyltransferase subunit B